MRMDPKAFNKAGRTAPEQVPAYLSANRMMGSRTHCCDATRKRRHGAALVATRTPKTGEESL